MSQGGGITCALEKLNQTAGRFLKPNHKPHVFVKFRAETEPNPLYTPLGHLQNLLEGHLTALIICPYQESISESQVDAVVQHTTLRASTNKNKMTILNPSLNKYPEPAETINGTAAIVIRRVRAYQDSLKGFKCYLADFVLILHQHTHKTLKKCTTFTQFDAKMFLGRFVSSSPQSGGVILKAN